MIKSLFFDFWGTIVGNGVFPSPTKQARYILGLEIPFQEYVQKFEEAIMLKKFDNLTQAFTEVMSAFELKPDQEKMDQLVGMWNKNKFFAKPFPDTKNVLELLKQHYKLYLVSNTDCFSVKEVAEKYELTQYFESMFLSYEVGKLKGDPTFYPEILKQLKLKPEEVIVIGDSLQSDMEPAEKAGMRSILVDRRMRREYKEKIRLLDELPGLLGV